MNDPLGLSMDVAELAALYAAGLLSASEMEAFEDRLVAGEVEARAAFEALRDVAAIALRGGGEVEPRLIVRSELINKLGLQKTPPSFARDEGGERQPDPIAEDATDMVLIRAAEADWKATAVAGVEARNLWVDRERGRITVMLRLAPGVVYPDHDHPDVEECLVIEGDLELGGKVMRAGDYMRIPKGGQHGTPRTVGGCLLLVTTPIVAAA